MNNDGFEPGQSLTFDQVQALSRKHRSAQLAVPNPAANESVTRESIASMAKDDVRELLDAHGAEYDGRTSVDDLRELLISIMFVDG